MMTYRINDTTTMAVVDFGDEDDFSTVELTVIFMRDGKDVPVSAVVPSIQAIDVQEDPFMDGYNLTVTYRDGNVTSKFCPKRHTVFNYLSKLVYRALEAEAATEESDPGIYLEPTAGAREFLVCHSGLSCSTKSPSLSYTWPEHASPFELSHVLSRVYIAMDSDTHIGYINAIDKLYTYYAAHGNQEAFDRMTLDILRDYYPNGEDDIIDERDEINVDRMRELERRYQATEAATEPAETAPAPPMTDDTTTATDAAEPSPEPIELTAEEAAAAAGISLDPVLGATEFLVCGGDFLESTKQPLTTVTWRGAASETNLNHIVFSAWVVVDSHDEVGYMRACDNVKEYFDRYCPHYALDRMHLAVFREHYPNGEADIKDEWDERAVVSMRRLEERYPDHVSEADRAFARRNIETILSTAKNVIKRCDKYMKLHADGFVADANAELGNIVTLGGHLQFEIVPFIGLDLWEDINDRAAAATNGKSDSRYWGYIAGEYLKWANEQLAAAT